MQQDVTTLTLKLEKGEKREFSEISSSLGMSPTAALKVLIRAFNRAGGFPFDVRVDRINYGSPRLIRPVSMAGDVVVVPDSWKDEDDD